MPAFAAHPATRAVAIHHIYAVTFLLSHELIYFYYKYSRQPLDKVMMDLTIFNGKSMYSSVWPFHLHTCHLHLFLSHTYQPAAAIYYIHAITIPLSCGLSTFLLYIAHFLANLHIMYNNICSRYHISKTCFCLMALKCPCWPLNEIKSVIKAKKVDKC
jgi:hypothetical protein